MSKRRGANPEHEFTLVLEGVPALTPKVMDAFFKAGCGDATVSRQHGRTWMDFARTAPTLKDAVLTAIRDVRRAGLGAEALRVDECGMVTQAEIARRLGRSRQLIHQYIQGKRGPGGFPPPACRAGEDAPLWEWCAVGSWLCRHGMMKPETLEAAETIAAVNNVLELLRRRGRDPKLVKEVTRAVGAA